MGFGLCEQGVNGCFSFFFTQADMKKFGYEEGTEEKMLTERRQLSQEVQDHREARLQIEARY